MKQLSAFFQKQVMLNQKNLVGELFMVFLVIGLFWVAKFQQIADLKIETFRIFSSRCNRVIYAMMPKAIRKPANKEKWCRR